MDVRDLPLVPDHPYRGALPEGVEFRSNGVVASLARIVDGEVFEHVDFHCGDGIDVGTIRATLATLAMMTTPVDGAPRAETTLPGGDYSFQLSYDARDDDGRPFRARTTVVASGADFAEASRNARAIAAQLPNAKLGAFLPGAHAVVP